MFSLIFDLKTAKTYFLHGYILPVIIMGDCPLRRALCLETIALYARNACVDEYYNASITKPFLVCNGKREMYFTLFYFAAPNLFKHHGH